MLSIGAVIGHEQCRHERMQPIDRQNVFSICRFHNFQQFFEMKANDIEKQFFLITVVMIEGGF